MFSLTARLSVAASPPELNRAEHKAFYPVEQFDKATLSRRRFE